MNELQSFELQLEEAQRNREQADADMRDAKARAERESKRVRALTLIVKGLRELEPSVDQPQAERLPIGPELTLQPLSLEQIEALETPRGQEALRQLMRGSNREWKPAQLISEIRDRGWIDPDAKTPEAAVRVALRRLVDAGEVERSDQGLYRYKDSDATASGQAALAADGLGSSIGEGVD